MEREKNSFRNPYSLALGTLIHRERKRSDEEKSVAKLLGVHESKLRLFESGKGTLNIEAAFKLAEVLPEFKFGQLVTLLTIQHYFQKSKTLQEVKSKIGIITKLDRRLKVVEILLSNVIDECLKLIRQDDLKAVVILLDNYNVINELRDFLVLNEYPISNESALVTKLTKELVNNVSSYDMEDVLLYCATRKEKPLQITNKIIEEWEKSNANQIKEVTGILVNHAFITKTLYVVKLK